MKKIIFLALTIFIGYVNLNAQTLNEGFETTVPPNDWELYSYGSAQTWSINSFTPIQGNFSTRITEPPFGSHNDWLVTPKLDITSVSDSIKFFLRTVEAGSDQALNIRVSTTGKDTASFTNMLAANVNPVGTGWEDFAFSLSAYNGQEIYIAFQAFNDGEGNMYLDSVTGPTLFVPTCPTISFVNFGIPTYNSIEATWDSIANGVGYNYSVFLQGQGPSGTPVKTGVSSDTTELITGLPMATDLELWVTTDCGSIDGLSEIDGPFQFSTICGPSEIEYIENFDSYIPICWTEGFGEISDSTVFTSTNSTWQAMSFGNAGLSQSAAVNVWNANRREWLFSPTLNLDSIPNSQISFFTSFTQFGFNNTNQGEFFQDDNIQVIISTDDGVTWSDTNVLVRYDSANVPVNIGSYETVSLSDYSGLVKIGFYMEKDISGGDMNFYFDDFRWGETPNCDIINQIDIDAFTAYTADVSWDTTTFAIGAIVEFGLDGFTLGTGTQVFVSGLDTTLTGLLPNTDYEVYVAPICSSTDTGDFLLSSSFTTECAPLEAFYLEPFNAFLPNDCWIEANTVFTDGVTVTSGFSSWVGDGFLNSGFTGAARINSFGFDNAWLISEGINLDSVGAPAQLEFDAGITAGFSTNSSSIGLLDTVYVVVSEDGGSTWHSDNIIYSIRNDNQPDNLGRHYEIPLINYTGAIKVAFYSKNGNGNFDFHLDNFEISEAPSCLPTFDYTLIDIADTTASISWSDLNMGTDYIVEYGYAGFTIGTGTIVTTSTTSIDLIGLDPVTEYDFYVRALCSPTDTANFGDITSFTTECAIISDVLFEDFTTYLPECWYEASGELVTGATLNNGSSNWGPKGYLNVGSTGSAKSRVSGFEQYHWLISEPLYLGADPKQIEFDAGQTSPFNTSNATFGADDRFNVVISTDDGATWSPSNILMQFDASLPLFNSGAHYTASLIDYVNAGNVRIGFYSHSDATNQDINVYVDNFQFEDLDTNAVDLAAIEVKVNPAFCIGDDEDLELIVENTGFVPVTSFSVKTTLTGAQNWNNNQSFFPTIPVGGRDTVVIRDLSTLASGNYSVEFLITPAGDVNALNNKVFGDFFISDYPTIFAGSDITICAGDDIPLTATGGVTYSWTHGLPNGSTLTPSVSTTYVVTGTNGFGCSTNDTVIVSVEQNAPPVINYLNETLYTPGLYDTYKWYIGTTLVSSNSTFNVTDNNVTVRLEVTTFSGCIVENTHFVETFDIIEIDEIGIVLSPNPVNNVLNLDGDLTNVSELRIYDLQGRVILDNISTVGQIDVSSLNTGLYILYGDKNGSKFQAKFTKQ